MRAAALAGEEPSRAALLAGRSAPRGEQRQRTGTARSAASAGLTRRDALVMAALAATHPARAQDTKPFDLETLMALLAQRQRGEARFTEERTVAGFDGPLRASGTLAFTAPDRFERLTLEPRRERMEVAGNQIRLERGGRARQLTLDAVPELAALFEGLRGTLSGNAEALRKHFDLRVSGQPGLWTLTLVPRDGALAAQVRQLQLAGSGADLRSVELQLGGGDRSLMLIEPVTPTAAGAVTAAPAATAASRPAVARTAASSAPR
jgi:hypothetical protein